MKIVERINGSCLYSPSPYPSQGWLLGNGVEHRIDVASTGYGYVVRGSCRVKDRIVKQSEYFCISAEFAEEVITAGEESIVALFIRLGFVGVFSMGATEPRGRMSYIDGCTDSILVGPPRMGDPCLNFLHFPPGVRQSFHVHPTIRLGVVAGGCGVACVSSGDEHVLTLPLQPGMLFLLEAQKLHRFETSSNSDLTVIAYHPDSDWGPTDQNHPMLNRTYLRPAGPSK
jgi:hypothetical protein